MGENTLKFSRKIDSSFENHISPIFSEKTPNNVQNRPPKRQPHHSQQYAASFFKIKSYHFRVAMGGVA